MLEPWNDSSILPPPVNTSKINTSFDVAELRHACNNIFKVLSKQSPLHKEAAIVSRFLYKFDKKFRNDIGYRNFKKVNTALRRYLTINLLKDIENFTSILPDENGNYLPTRQMLQYVLVRIMTFAKLMLRICVCSKLASVFYLDRVKRGESHWMSLMPYALLSRVWTMTSVLLQYSVSWYNCLHQFVSKLTLKGMKFLPDGYNLPEDLKEWLDIDNIDNFGRIEWSQKKQIDFGQIIDEDGDAQDSILGYLNEISHEDNLVIESDVIPDLLNKSGELKVEPMQKIDHGEAISRESYILNNFKNRMVNDGYIHSADRVTSVTRLKEFIDKEEKYRSEGNRVSLTQHISLMQWHALKNNLLGLCQSISNDRKVEMKFHKIWKDKCLDYV